MNTFTTYSIEVNLLLLVFYTFYRIFLYNDTLFVGKRVYLLVAAGISLLLPLGDILIIPLFTHNDFIKVNLNGAFIYKLNSTINSPGKIDYKAIFLCIFFIGIIVSSILFIKNLIQIIRIIRHGEKTKQAGYVFVKTSTKNLVFSFLNYLVVPLDEENKEEVFIHEMTHIRQRHTYDMFFFEFLSIFFWYNPIIYLFKFSIKEIHEFLADESVIKNNKDSIEYTKTILSYALHTDTYLLSESFIDRSFLKRRILMLTRRTKPSSRNTFTRYLLCLPLLLSTLFLTCCININSSDFEQINSTTNINSSYIAPQFVTIEGKTGYYMAKNIKNPEQAMKERIRWSNLNGSIY